MRATPPRHHHGGSGGTLTGPVTAEAILGAMQHMLSLEPAQVELMRDTLKPLAGARVEFDLVTRQLERAYRRTAVAPGAPTGLLPYPPPGSSREALHELAVACGAAHAPIEVAPGEFAILGPVPHADRIMGTGFTRGRAPAERASPTPAQLATLLLVDAVKSCYTELQLEVAPAGDLLLAHPVLRDAELKSLGGNVGLHAFTSAGAELDFADAWTNAILTSASPPALPLDLQLAQLYVAWPPVAQAAPSAAEIAAFNCSSLAPVRAGAGPGAHFPSSGDTAILYRPPDLEGREPVTVCGLPMTRTLIKAYVQLFTHAPPCKCCPAMCFSYRGGHYSLHRVADWERSSCARDGASTPHAAALAHRSVDELLAEIEGPAAASPHSSAKRGKGKGGKQGGASAPAPSSAQPLLPPAAAPAAASPSAEPASATPDEEESAAVTAGDAALAAQLAAATAAAAVRRARLATLRAAHAVELAAVQPPPPPAAGAAAAPPAADAAAAAAAVVAAAVAAAEVAAVRVAMRQHVLQIAAQANSYAATVESFVAGALAPLEQQLAQLAVVEASLRQARRAVQDAAAHAAAARRAQQLREVLAVRQARVAELRAARARVSG